MSWTPGATWRPTRLMAVAGSADTSTGVTEVTTDAGAGFVADNVLKWIEAVAPWFGANGG